MRKKNLQDAKYEKLEVTPVDVKALMDNKNDKGVSDFWGRVMATDSDIMMALTEKDSPIV